MAVSSVLDIKRDKSGSGRLNQPFFLRKKPAPFTSDKKKFFAPKLTIGQPGDQFEKEADSMADHVVNSLTKNSGSQIQRKCKECEEEEKVQPKRNNNQDDLQMKTSEEEEDEALQKKKDRQTSDNRTAHASLSSRLNNNKSRGRELPCSTRRMMEHSFGADFSKVSIHTDVNAIQMSRDLHAQAFTHGSDIYFNQGKFNPSSTSGKHLLAHELTHVIQQTGMIQKQEEGEGSFDSTTADKDFLAGYTQCDFLDDRITYEAQFALYHLYKRGGANRADALSMLGAVQDGLMQGIYKQDQAKPALMAQRHGTVWWEMIPKGQGAVVFEPEDETPMMAFKISIANDRAALADALQNAWLASSVGQLAIVIPPPSLKPCPLIPSPEPEPEPEPEPVPEKECPPGTTFDPEDDTCILDLPGTIKTECTDAEMDREFQKQEDFCANVRMAIDLSCKLGANPCDLAGAAGKFGRVGKFVCGLISKETAVCSQPRAEFFEKCIVSTVTGEKDNMPCFPGTPSQIQEKYKRWPGKET